MIFVTHGYTLQWGLTLVKCLVRMTVRVLNVFAVTTLAGLPIAAAIWYSSPFDLSVFVEFVKLLPGTLSTGSS